MKRSTRLPHWHFVWGPFFIRGWRLSLLLKLLIGILLVLYFFWNVTTFVLTMQSRPPGLRSHGDVQDLHGDVLDQRASVLDPHASVQSLDDSYEEFPEITDSEEAWWLQPDMYIEDGGCDFSAVVALFKPRQLELNCGNINKLDVGDYVGRGYWRKVYKTTWNGREVAVKRVKKELLARSDIVPRHVEECASIFSLRNDPNIVKLVGWCLSTVVVEFIPNQLDTLLFDSKEPISVHRALELARDAARGVAQLHRASGGPFAHADIQARQFLINANGTLQLNDFNRVKYTGPRLVDGKPTSDKCTFHTSVAKGKWRSPEEYQRHQLDEKVDVYSLSLVLWTLRAREKPFRSLKREAVYEKVPTGVRPPLEAMSDFPQQMQDLIVRGWDTDPTKRPTSEEMADEIDRILMSYESKQ